MVNVIIFENEPEIDYMCEKFINLDFNEHTGNVYTEDILKLFEICLNQNKTIILSKHSDVCKNEKEE